jgi:hypothetical protein
MSYETKTAISASIVPARGAAMRAGNATHGGRLRWFDDTRGIPMIVGD